MPAKPETIEKYPLAAMEPVFTADELAAERWLPIAGYDGRYEVSDLGRVRTVWRRAKDGSRRDMLPPTILKAGATTVTRGYRHVNLVQNSGKHGCRQLHHLVADTFLGPLPPGMQRAHDDGKPWNNRLSNIGFKTPAENQQDKVRHGTMVMGEAHKNSRLTEANVRYIRTSPKGVNELARELRIAPSAVCNIRALRSWRHI